MNVDVNKAVSDVRGLTEHLTENQASSRHQTDMDSDSKLSKAVRPISTFYSGVIWGISVIWTLKIADNLISTVGIEEASSLILSPDSIVMYVLAATTTTYGTHIGFYFNSKRKERVELINAKAAVELEELRTRAEIRSERKAARKAK